MLRVVDYLKAEPAPDRDGSLERGRLEHLLAGYQAFLGHDLANQLVSVQAFARLLQEQLQGSIDPDAEALLGRLAAIARRCDQNARRLADVGRLLREPPWGPTISFVEVAHEAVA